MPGYSDDRLLQRAINAAVLDRESLSEAYGGRGPVSDKALETATKVQALVGKKLAKLSEDEQQAAFSAFLYAEQWERTLAEALVSRKLKEQSSRLADQFKGVRHRRWGRTKLEVLIETAEGCMDILPGGVFKSRPRNKEGGA